MNYCKPQCMWVNSTCITVNSRLLITQRSEIGDNCSCWSEISFGIPQLSIVGPLLLNIFLVNLFFVMTDIDNASYADDSAPFILEKNVLVICLIDSKIIV